MVSNHSTCQNFCGWCHWHCFKHIIGHNDQFKHIHTMFLTLAHVIPVGSLRGPSNHLQVSQGLMALWLIHLGAPNPNPNKLLSLLAPPNHQTIHIYYIYMYIYIYFIYIYIYIQFIVILYIYIYIYLYLYFRYFILSTLKILKDP